MLSFNLLIRIFDINLSELAKESGYSLAQISVYETGKQKVSLEFKKRMVKAVRKLISRRITKESLFPK